MAVLCALARADGPVGISELARQTGFSKSTVHLSLQSMRAAGFVEQDVTSTGYVLGLAAAQLGAVALDQSRLVDMLAPAMKDLAERSEEAVSLGVRAGSEVVFVKRFETSHVLRTSIREGTRMPLHASASGKVLLLGMPIEEILELYPDEQLPSQASRTFSTRAELLADLEVTRQQGYSTSHDEFVDGVSAAAVPVCLGRRIVASVSIAGPTSRFRADEWIADLEAIVSPLTLASETTDAVDTTGSTGTGEVAS
jgi:DNA-binding IclR family transcriptional regulator